VIAAAKPELRLGPDGEPIWPDRSSMSEEERKEWNPAIEAFFNLKTASSKRPRGRKFQANFVIFPVRWIDALENANADRSAYRLALRLLLEAHMRAYHGGDVVLSSEVTRLPRNSKHRAVKKLQTVGLIRVEKRGLRQSPVAHIMSPIKRKV
jgi:hypothetical protein